MAEIGKVLQQAEQREIEEGSTLQTPIYAQLAARRLEEAEAAARQTVSDLEKENATFGNNLTVVQSKNLVFRSGSAVMHEQKTTAGNNSHPSLLAEALIAHGIPLERLKKCDAAQATLERAIAVAQAADAPVQAGLAALTMIEEVEGLSRETLLRAYELASSTMLQMGNRELQWRVIHAARKVMANLWGEMDSDRALEILLARPPSLREEMDCCERRRSAIKKKTKEMVPKPIVRASQLM